MLPYSGVWVYYTLHSACLYFQNAGCVIHISKLLWNCTFSPHPLLTLVSTGWAVHYRAFSSETTGNSAMYLQRPFLVNIAMTFNLGGVGVYIHNFLNQEVRVSLNVITTVYCVSILCLLLFLILQDISNKSHRRRYSCFYRCGI